MSAQSRYFHDLFTDAHNSVNKKKQMNVSWTLDFIFQKVWFYHARVFFLYGGRGGGGDSWRTALLGMSTSPFYAVFRWSFSSAPKCSENQLHVRVVEIEHSKCSVGHLKASSSGSERLRLLWLWSLRDLDTSGHTTPATTPVSHGQPNWMFPANSLPPYQSLASCSASKCSVRRGIFAFAAHDRRADAAANATRVVPAGVEISR